MAQISLVEQRIEHGEELLQTLAQSHFNVAAAAWVRAEPQDDWELYVATPGIHQVGTRDAYLHIQGTIRNRPDWKIGLLDVKLIDAESELGKDLVELAHRHPFKATTCFALLGGAEIQEAYVYPATQP